MQKAAHANKGLMVVAQMVNHPLKVPIRKAVVVISAPTGVAQTPWVQRRVPTLLVALASLFPTVAAPTVWLWLRVPTWKVVGLIVVANLDAVQMESLQK